MRKSSGTSPKKDYPILLFLLCGIMLQAGTSCSNRNVPLKSVSFDNVNREITLKLSNLLQEFLLGNVSRIAITNQYILTIEQTKVCQFSRQGKFIRQLMVRGNGPNEFNTVVFPVTVPGSELFYYMDWGKDITHTYRINLETGEHLPPFSPGSDYYCLYAADRKGNLYGIPNSGMRTPSYPNPDTLNIAFQYHPGKNLRHSYSSGQSYMLNMDNNTLTTEKKSSA